MPTTGHAVCKPAANAAKACIGFWKSYLNAGIADVADLFAVELLPLLAVKLVDERNDVLWTNHVDEGVTHVAFVFEVDGQVEEVICPTELLINGGQQHLLSILIGNVLDHERRALVVTCKAR